MSKLDQQRDVVQMALELGLDWRNQPVQAIVDHCIQTCRRWIKDHGSIKSIADLERLVCEKLQLQFEEVRTDAELQDVIRKYVRLGDPVFLQLVDDLDEETYATLIERRAAASNAPDRYVAVVDLRGRNPQAPEGCHGSSSQRIPPLQSATNSATNRRLRDDPRSANARDSCG